MFTRSCLALVSCLLVADLSRAAELKRDIEYGRAGGESLRLDASVPESPGPHPIAILVHGGGWRRGDKSGSSTPGDNADITPWFAPLTAAGFTWFSINYRLAPAHRWPACLEDVQTAIRWAKAHAAEYNGDPRRIALLGHSAGGHLVCLAATEAHDDTRVQAVVGFAAVTDLEHALAQRAELSVSLQNLFGLPSPMSPATRAVLHGASPLHKVRSGLPPFLLLHGDADPGVSLQQSIHFQSRVRAAGGTCDLITIAHGPHALLEWERLDPTYQQKMMAWLLRQLPTVDPTLP